MSAEVKSRLFLDNVVRFYGIPRQVIHDRDPRFTRLFWKALFEIIGIKLLYSSAHHPQNDEQTKQANKVLEQILRTMATDVDANWVSKLGFAEFVINSLVNAATGKISFGLVYRQQARNVINQLNGLHHIKGAQQMVDKILNFVEESKIRLLQAQESQAKYYD